MSHDPHPAVPDTGTGPLPDRRRIEELALRLRTRCEAAYSVGGVRSGAMARVYDDHAHTLKGLLGGADEELADTIAITLAYWRRQLHWKRNDRGEQERAKAEAYTYSIGELSRLLSAEEVMPTFTKTLTDGRTATVTREAGEWSVAIDGVLYTTGTLRGRPEADGAVTHMIGVRKAVGFTGEEVAALQAILDAEVAAYRATPAGRYVALVTDVDLASGAWTSAREHAADTGDWSQVRPAEENLEAAEAALDAFNAEYPEFAAADAVKQAAREDAHLRAGFRD